MIMSIGEKMSNKMLYNMTAMLGISLGTTSVLAYCNEANKGKEPNVGYLFTSIALIANSMTLLLGNPNKKVSKLEEKLEE